MKLPIKVGAHLHSMNILFVTGFLSPFWLEFADAVAKQDGVSIRIAFGTPSAEDRGAHWKSPESGLSQHFVYKANEALEAWMKNVFEIVQPEVVICGGVLEKWAQIAIDIAKKKHLRIGIFAEQPNPATPLVSFLKRQYYKVRYRSIRPDFVLAVGDRAFDYYRQVLPTNSHVAMMPYYQDLSPAFQVARGSRPAHVRFLFSGRLLARNSIRQMTDAFARLADARPGRFTWCISGYGPEEQYIARCLQLQPALARVVSFDREFTKWNDRLRPFQNADVLVVPAEHSGWGLVVPEALACGLAVITTRYVEAARYFVEDGLNGIFVETTAASIYTALEYCVDNVDAIQRMQSEARELAIRGDVKLGSKRFINLMNRWFSGQFSDEA